MPLFCNMKKFVLFSVACACVFSSCKPSLDIQSLPVTAEPGPISYEKEVHLKNIKQLTYGGNNAEAYWSPEGKRLIFQSDNAQWGVGCDQIFILNVEGKQDSTRRQLVSTGLGRTTCYGLCPMENHLYMPLRTNK